MGKGSDYRPVKKSVFDQNFDRAFGIKDIMDFHRDKAPDYRVYSTSEKTYIEKSGACVARLCKISAEFFETNTSINDCSFEDFQRLALERGYVVEDEHRPASFKSENAPCFCGCHASSHSEPLKGTPCIVCGCILE